MEHRRAIRRAELLAAGIALLGGPAGPTVTVRAVCRRAGLTERYFYESFTDRDEFVRSVYDEVGQRAQQVLLEAVHSVARTHEAPGLAVEAFVALMVDEPAVGRVLLRSPLTEPALRGRGMALMPAFVRLVHDQLCGLSGPGEKQLAAVGVVGALTSLFLAYLEGALEVSRGTFVEHCVALVVGANRSAG